jgi:hypothetical protein
MGKSARGAKVRVTEYYLSVHFGICTEIDELLEIQIAEKPAWQGSRSENGNIAINQPELFGGVKKEGGARGIAYLLKGGPLQMLPLGLAQRLGLTETTAPGFRNICGIWFVGTAPATGWAPIPGVNNPGTGGDGDQGSWQPPGGGGGGQFDELVDLL